MTLGRWFRGALGLSFIVTSVYVLWLSAPGAQDDAESRGAAASGRNGGGICRPSSASAIDDDVDLLSGNPTS